MKRENVYDEAAARIGAEAQPWYDSHPKAVDRPEMYPAYSADRKNLHVQLPPSRVQLKRKGRAKSKASDATEDGRHVRHPGFKGVPDYMMGRFGHRVR